MEILDVLKSPAAVLPKERPEGDFIEFYKQISSDFIELISKCKDNGPITNIILSNIDNLKVVSESIAQTLKLYFDGHPSKAYENMEAGVRDILPYFDHIVSKPIKTEYLKNLYRIRKAEEKPFGKIEMFHIPFHLRHHVATQRYSIPGFPSLYLSNSIYTAWKELLCPDFDEIIAVRIQPTEEVKVLDFGTPPQYLADTIDAYNKTGSKTSVLGEWLSARIITWPILAACSIKVLNRKAAFKPEYIIPQILLQLVRNNVFGEEVSGLRYFSMNFGQKNHSISIGSNFVFPVKSSEIRGICPELKKLFLMTEPLSWQLASIVDHEVDLSETPDVRLEIISGQMTHYKDTKFARFEAMLIEQLAEMI